MFKPRHRASASPRIDGAGRGEKTKTDKLLQILGDERWHSTVELVHRVGHCFSHAKYKLVSYGYPVDKRKHPRKPRQYQYRIHAAPGEPFVD